MGLVQQGASAVAPVNGALGVVKVAAVGPIPGVAAVEALQVAGVVGGVVSVTNPDVADVATHCCSRTSKLDAPGHHPSTGAPSRPGATYMHS